MRPIAAAMALVLAPLVCLGQPGPDRVQALPPVEEFVHQTFVHGVDYGTASQYQAADARTLLGLLDEPSEERYWTNIVTTIGFIGDTMAVRALVDFLHDSSGPVSQERFLAKAAVLFALGYLANAGSDSAFAYLIGSLDDTAWTQRPLRWESPFHPERTARDVFLTEMAIAGLALSGREEAGDVLRAIADTRDPGFAEIRRRSSATVDDALRTWRTVQAGGLAAYYANPP